jgi:hypothetical protein
MHPGHPQMQCFLSLSSLPNFTTLSLFLPLSLSSSLPPLASSDPCPHYPSILSYPFSVLFLSVLTPLSSLRVLLPATPFLSSFRPLSLFSFLHAPPLSSFRPTFSLPSCPSPHPLSVFSSCLSYCMSLHCPASPTLFLSSLPVLLPVLSPLSSVSVLTLCPSSSFSPVRPPLCPLPRLPPVLHPMHCSASPSFLPAYRKKKKTTRETIPLILVYSLSRVILLVGSSFVVYRNSSCISVPCHFSAYPSHLSKFLFTFYMYRRVACHVLGRVSMQL